MVQFTVKHEQKIDCGGGYVKVREYKRVMGKREEIERLCQ